MTHWKRFFTAALVAVVASTAVGCHRSSHRSVRTYDYSDDPRGREPANRPAQPDPEARSGEYEMVSPGEMVGPGEMVPPGKPVVDPD